MRTINRRIWRTVFSTTAVNLALLFAADLLIRRGALPAAWQLRGLGLIWVLLFALWTGVFVWLVTHPFSAGLRMVLKEKINRIDYVLLFGIALVTISYWALVYFIIERLDPNGIEFTGTATSPAEMLYVSALAFLSMGLDIMTPKTWWPRLAVLAETVMGLGYLAGILALLTNRLASEPGVDAQRDAPGPDLPTGSAWAGGGAAGAAVGSVAGPVGTAVGAAVGGLLANEAVEHLPQRPAPGEKTRRPPRRGASRLSIPAEVPPAEEEGEAQGHQRQRPKGTAELKGGEEGHTGVGEDIEQADGGHEEAQKGAKARRAASVVKEAAPYDLKANPEQHGRPEREAGVEDAQALRQGEAAEEDQGDAR